MKWFKKLHVFLAAGSTALTESMRVEKSRVTKCDREEIDEKGIAMKKSLTPIILLLTALANSATAQVGTLIDNGDGTITDPDAGLMWTSNASLPGSTSVTYTQAVAWVNNLNYAGHTDWRLPTGTDPRSDPTGHTDDGQYYYGCRGSELGDLFYNVLGGCSGWPIDIMCVGYSTQPNTDPDLQQFDNILLTMSIFWTDMSYDSTRTWTFNFDSGGYRAINSSPSSTYRLRVWAVRDLGPPPQPEACCGVDDVCRDMLPSECLSAGRWPQGPGTRCQGDRDGSGLDDACERTTACCTGTSQWDDSCFNTFNAQACDDQGGHAVEGLMCDRGVCWPQACCYLDGSCDDLRSFECGQGRVGTPLGPLTQCLGDNSGNARDDACEEPAACCWVNGDCTDTAPALCGHGGGWTQGAGSQCVGDLDGSGYDDSCEPILACCGTDGSCFNAFSAQSCRDQGGYPKTPGLMCNSPGVCDEDRRRACCMPGGYCQDVHYLSCLDPVFGGVPQDIGVMCADNPCVVQACCLSDGSCVDRAPWDCPGTPQGPGVMCSPGLCGGPACPGDLDGDGTIMISDLGRLVSLLGQAGPPYRIAEGDPLWDPSADMDGNGIIMISDLGQLISILGAAGPPYRVACP